MQNIPTSFVLAAFILAFVLSPMSHAEDLKPAAAEKPKTYQGLSASLSIAKRECKVDAPVEVVVMIASANETLRLFNPFFNGLLEQPGRILVRDSDGKVVNRLLAFHSGSLRTANDGDYVTLPGGGFIGTKLSIYPSPKGGSLPAADYTVELVLHGVLLGLSGKDAAKEVVTSERVALRIVK